jgi:dTDP-4-dehydrorhamnose reductase
MVKKKIFIFGSKGQLGKYLLENLNLNKKKYKIISVQKNYINFLNFERNIKRLNNLKPDLIINCAGYTNVDLAEKEREKSYVLNYKCIKKLRNFCDKNSIILIHFSTDYVFNGKNIFYEPSYKCSPINYYGYTKYLGEKEILKLKKNYFIFRISWLLSSNKKSFLKRIQKKIKQKKKFEVITDSFSCPTTVIFIKKFFERNIDIFFQKKLKGIFHLVNPSVISYYKMVKFIEKLIFKKNCDIIKKGKFFNYKTIAIRPKISKLSIKKTKKYFKIPKNTWKQDIIELLNEQN